LPSAIEAGCGALKREGDQQAEKGEDGALAGTDSCAGLLWVPGGAAQSKPAAKFHRGNYPKAKDDRGRGAGEERGEDHGAGTSAQKPITL
jgi:hypothetical protein